MHLGNLPDELAYSTVFCSPRAAAVWKCEGKPEQPLASVGKSKMKVSKGGTEEGKVRQEEGDE